RSKRATWPPPTDKASWSGRPNRGSSSTVRSSRFGSEEPISVIVDDGAVCNAIALGNARGGLRFGFAGGQHDAPGAVARDKIEEMKAVDRLAQSLAQVRQMGDAPPIDFVEHEVILFLVADVIGIREHLGEEHQRRPVLGLVLVIIIIEPERRALLPFGSPALEVGDGEWLKNQATQDEVLRRLVIDG